jgi:hypothetical protein
MITTKKLICILVAGTALGTAVPVFANPGNGHYRDRHGYQDRDRDRRGYYGRDHHRHSMREVERRRVVVIERPYVVERHVPVYYPAPAPGPGLGEIIGAAVGAIYDRQQ